MFQQRNGAKYSESEIKNDNFTVKLSFLFTSENSVILHYTRNIVQLNSFYIKFDSKHFFIYIIYNKYYTIIVFRWGQYEFLCIHRSL
jgi:hypothetical protein